MNFTAEFSIPCTLNYPDLNDATRCVFGLAFVLCGLLAAVGNTLSSMVLVKPAMRTKSIKFLSSLVISDNLVGYILCPLSAIQLFWSQMLSNCYMELLRVFLSTALCGVSAITVALIAYDRYIMLSSLSNYNALMNKRKMRGLILLAWLFPFALQLFYVVNGLLYLFALCVLTIGPFVIISVSYHMMKNKIAEKAEELASHSHRLRPGYKPSSNEALQMERNERKNLKLARNLTILILCYIICLLPALFNFLAEIIIRAKKQDKSIGLQVLTVFSLFCASANSVVNPIIYVSKYAEFKREFRKMVGIHENNRQQSRTEFSSVFMNRMSSKTTNSLNPYW